MQARDIDSVLSEIEKNNLELQALRMNNKADVLETTAANMLEAPSVEYSPFFHKETSGVASSELIISQEFDFPTLYSARGKSARLQAELLDARYLSSRRDLLLSAKEMCLDIIMLDESIKLTEQRLGISDELLSLVGKRMKEGEATILEENRVKMEKIDLQTELIQYQTERQGLTDRLTAINGNKPVDLEDMVYPMASLLPDSNQIMEAIMNDDAGLKAAGAAVGIMRQEVSVARQGWIPRLTIGYRRNTDGSEASNGFLVGASFPIYSTGRKIKAAAARQAAAQIDMENSRLALESEAHSLYNELQQLKKSMDIFDADLLSQSLSILKKSVDAGNMTMIDYYTEADKIYQKKINFISVSNRYQKVLSRIYRNSL